MSNWSKPIPVTKPETVFGGDIEKLMPAMADIPDEFYRSSNEWVKIQSHWFYKGLPGTTVVKPKEGINTKEAFDHLSAIQSSFEPKHEHKMAGIAYLMSLWFDEISIPETTKT
jgi:hypothetical protein